jgi:hypothetical protein
MMRPLAKEEETDAEVTWEDQNNINSFSKLHNKLADLQDLLTDKNVHPPNPLQIPVFGVHVVDGRRTSSHWVMHCRKSS